MEGTIYVITVFGMENGKCHYSAKIINASGDVIPGMPATDCYVPKEKISEGTFWHFFGQDKEPGNEAIKAEQDKIEADYCTKG